MSEIWRWEPDWSQPVVERLEWLTDIRESTSGIEYRERLREHPRRSPEFRAVNLGDGYRDLETALWSTGVDEWIMPLWWDVAISSAGTSGSWTGPGIGQYRDWRFSPAFVVATNGDDWEAFTANVIGSNQIGVAGGIPAHLQGAGIRIYPARTAFVSPTITRNTVTGDIETVDVSASLIDYTSPAGVDLPASLDGLDVLDDPQNRRSAQTATFSRRVNVVDYRTGRRGFVDDPGNPSVDRGAEYLHDDRETLWGRRRWLQKIGGRHGEFLRPTGNRDLAVVYIEQSGSNTVIGVEFVDYGDTYWGQEPRQRVSIKMRDGQYHHANIIDFEDDAGLDRLTLDLPWDDFTLDQIRQVSWLEPVRLMSDSVDIQWVSSGIAELSLAARTLREVA